MRPGPLAPALFALALLAPGAALATSRLPAAVQKHLALSYTPPCRLCHLDGKTGGGTVVTPFGLSARARGLTGQDTVALDTALDRLASDHVDSDGDGAEDVAELKAGTDPNSPALDAQMITSDPGYGCGGAPHTPKPASAASLAPIVAILLAAWRRRARR